MERAGAITRIYASALLQLAEESGALEERVDEVRAVLQVLREERGLSKILASPKVDVKRKLELVRSVFDKRISAHLLNLFLLLIEKNRHMFLTGVLESFVDQWNEAHGRVKANVATAARLDEDEAGHLADACSKMIGKELVLSREVEPELLGGAVLRYGDTVVDGSLRRRIQRMKGELLTSMDRRGR